MVLHKNSWLKLVPYNNKLGHLSHRHNLSSKNRGFFFICLCGTFSYTMLSKAMFGLVENDGMDWNGMGWFNILLFGFVKNVWNGMECDGISSIKYHSFSQFSIPPKLGGIQWNGTLKQCNYNFVPTFHSQFCSPVYHSLFFSPSPLLIPIYSHLLLSSLFVSSTSFFA